MGASDDLCELLRTNDAVLLSAIDALLAGAYIPHLVTDQNTSVLAGGIDVFPRRLLVRNCCAADARELLTEAGYGDALEPDRGTLRRPVAKFPDLMRELDGDREDR